MTDTVTQIQTRVQWEARDTNYSCVDTNGLFVFNSNYRRLASIIPWPELNRSDTSATTTADQEAVTWPSVKFIDVTSIELQDPSDNLNYKSIPAVRDEATWSLTRAKPADFPEVYKRAHDGTQNVIQFAPKPHTGALSLRVTGQIEPTEVTAAASTTVFIGQTADDVLGLMIAADIMDKRAQGERSLMLLKRAAELLSTIAGREITPAELKGEPANG